MSSFTRDLAYAWRSLRRSPVFAIVVVITLSLGIGANAAVLGVIDTMFFRRLAAVPHPERVIAIYSSDKRDRPGARNAGGGWSSLSDYLNLRTRVHGVTGLATYSMTGVDASEAISDPDVWTAFVSGNYFDVLDVRAQIGRTIRADEEEPVGAHPVVVISDFIWRTRFGGDPGVLGREIQLEKAKLTVIGVAPPGFTGVHAEGRTNFWIPFTMRPAINGDTSRSLTAIGHRDEIIGRLAPSATLAEVRASVANAEHDLRESFPAADSLLALRAAIRDRMTTPEASTNGLIWLGTVWVMVALLHLVACSNVASLMLGRAAARRRELGVRLCLGASRARILIEGLTEAGVLAFFGAVGGLLVGRWLSGLIASMQFLSTTDPGLDIRVVAIVGIVAVATVLQFGLLPALEASRTDPLALLRGATAARPRGGLDRAGMVVVAQVAVSILLLGNAAAFLQLFAHQNSADPGYDVQHVLIAAISPRGEHTTPADWAIAYDDAVARARSVPGVRSVGAAKGAPMMNAGWFEPVIIPGRPPTDADRLPVALQAIGPGYFEAVGTPMARGREFTLLDRIAAGAERDNFDVVVINEAMARRYWPGVDPLGKQLGLQAGARATIVGVVRDMHDVSTVDFAPRAYFPLLETRYSAFNLVVRGGGDATAMFAPLAAALRTSTTFGRPTLRSLSAVRDDALALSRVAAVALSICAGVAMLLTAVGLYGIVTMWAARRRAEIGIRLALGSPTRSVHRLLLSDAIRLVGIGCALGLVCAFGMVQVERGRLGPYLSLGAIPIAVTLAVFLAVGGFAALIPSARAARQAPADVLRAG